MTLSVGSALEPKCQFLKGYDNSLLVGEFKAPATAYDDGYIVKMSSDGETWELCADNDGTHMLAQPCRFYHYQTVQ